MTLKPVLTEKSLEEAKSGRYTFWVDKGYNKYQIKKLISDVFDVTVLKVRTISLKGEKKKTYKGRIKVIKPRKKAIVILGEKEKIDLFEEKKSKK